MPKTTNQHNMYTLIGMQLGLIGLVSMLSIFYYQIKLSFSSSNKFIRDLGITLPLVFLVIIQGATTLDQNVKNVIIMVILVNHISLIHVNYYFKSYKLCLCIHELLFKIYVTNSVALRTYASAKMSIKGYVILGKSIYDPANPPSSISFK